MATVDLPRGTNHELPGGEQHARGGAPRSMGALRHASGSSAGCAGGAAAGKPRSTAGPAAADETPEDDHMRKATAAAGSIAHFVLQPGVVAGLVPWWLTGWRVRQPLPSWAWTPLRAAGVVLLAAGVIVLVRAFVRFVLEGVGTPAPVAPTRRLVVGGPYRYVRNPMYLAVTAVIVGQALALGQPGLLLYAAAVGAAMVIFVHGYEEPVLTHRFGAEYEAYQRAVPAWWPRRHPWQPG
jgi:protein-S-isoprenylcysteine O-methyltransferase Ste14